MNIQNLYGSVPTTSTTSVGAIQAPTASPSSIPPAVGGAATASISGPGQFFSEMQQLSQSNPAEFKAVAAQVATSFQNAASQASGPQAKMLNNLAHQFTQASQTGTLQAPTSGQGAQGAQAAQNAGSGSSASGGGHHHHHHHGGGGMGQSSQVQQAFDSAMSILTQAQQGTPTSTTTT
jgi:hypothetical protein